ncbi:hypothetical protein E2C01_013773 [Portunus trituberculatus]|uniref:Uncharacterized protein n=1 Tax=Portunus trituberculatus TaxID=210409 RepID=A0A5B7DI93_PORTR|nr:hypothetical protein [Portunus trituberculatus]
MARGDECYFKITVGQCLSASRHCGRAQQQALLELTPLRGWGGSFDITIHRFIRRSIANSHKDGHGILGIVIKP